MTAGPGGRLGGRDRCAHADRFADARRAVVPGDGALRHAGGDTTLLEDAAVNIEMAGAGRWSRCSPRRKAPPLSLATATTSRKASSSYTTVANASWSWGNIGYIASGAAGAFPAVQSVRCLGRSDLCGERRLPAERRLRDEPQDAIGHPEVQGSDRQLSVAAAGDAGAGEPPDDLPGDEVEDMPDISADSFSIAFGDFNAAIWSSIAPASRCCVIPIPRSLTCCSTRPSAWAAACRTSMPSS